ncbi:MAG: hypothetical protein IPO92_17765 [Saprospiraceae bacterium]|nr:hypothetical protein [Saprospiraceae bacterium]
MIKNLFILLTIVLPCVLDAQSFWKKTEESKIVARSGEERTIVPEKYQTFFLDIKGLKTYLLNAPLETAADRKSKELVVDIPMADGRIEQFKVYESPVMESEISARYPDIKSYKAYSTVDKSRHIRFSVSQSGFHGAIFALDGEKYIDPYSTLNSDDYIVYNVKDHIIEGFSGVCGVTEQNTPKVSSFKSGLRNTGEVELRTFRLALACSGEWGARRGTVAKCLEDMNIIINRLNIIYERELAIKLVIINDNDKIIFLDPLTDPYPTFTSLDLILDANPIAINSKIPINNYDIGHVMTICVGSAVGKAETDAVCRASGKARGATCENNFPLIYVVNKILAHELGHQFNAYHTWNSCPDFADQRQPRDAYEPGSGSTIMSYGGHVAPKMFSMMQMIISMLGLWMRYIVTLFKVVLHILVQRKYKHSIIFLK